MNAVSPLQAVQKASTDLLLVAVDTTQELNACGACLEEGGMDCEAIPNVELVTCALSRCEIRASSPKSLLKPPLIDSLAPQTHASPASAPVWTRRAA